MAIITKITTQQKNKDRFNIFIDDGSGERYAFSVDSDVLINFQLKKGMDIDEFSFLEIQFQDDIRKAYNLAIHYLSRRMRSEKEIKDYLVQKDIEEAIIHEVLHKLASHKYINDKEYAISYVRTQMNTTDKGPDLIHLELKERGIEESLRLLALEEYHLELQVEKAMKLSEKYFKKNQKVSDRILKQKIEQHLVRKGYSFEVIQLAVMNADTAKGLDEEMEAIRYQGEKAHRKYAMYNGYEYSHKMKQALYRKGFPMDIIEKYLMERQNHD